MELFLNKKLWGKIGVAFCVTFALDCYADDYFTITNYTTVPLVLQNVVISSTGTPGFPNNSYCRDPNHYYFGELGTDWVVNDPNTIIIPPTQSRGFDCLASSGSIQIVFDIAYQLNGTFTVLKNNKFYDPEAGGSTVTAGTVTGNWNNFPIVYGRGLKNGAAKVGCGWVGDSLNIYADNSNQNCQGY